MKMYRLVVIEGGPAQILGFEAYISREANAHNEQPHLIKVNHHVNELIYFYVSL